MNNKDIEKLLTYPETKELIDFMADEVLKLDTVADIKQTHPVIVAVEVQARQKAVEILKNILNPLINFEKRAIIGNNKDYDIVVE